MQTKAVALEIPPFRTCKIINIIKNKSAAVKFLGFSSIIAPLTEFNHASRTG